MTAAFYQLRKLLAKNWLLYRRTWLVSLLELALPILLSLFAIVIRRDIAIDHYPSKQYVDTNESALLPGVELLNTSFLKYISNSYRNCSQNGNIGVVVLAPAAQPIIEQLQAKLDGLGYRTILADNDQSIDQMVQHPMYMTDDEHPGLCFAVTAEFKEGHYRYNLRFNITNNDETTEGPSPNFPATFFFKFYPWAIVSPLRSGMLQMHNLMLNFILKTELGRIVEKASPFEDLIEQELENEVIGDFAANLTGLNVSTIKQFVSEFRQKKSLPVSLNTVVSPMIQEPYQVDMIENFLGAPIDLVTLLPLLLLYLRQTAWMLEEKENRVKQTLRMMGMHIPSYFASWLLHYFLLYVMVSGAHSLVLYSVFRLVSFWLILLTFLLFDLVLILQSFFVQALCTRAKTGVMVALLLFAVQFLVSFVYKGNPEKSYGMAAGVSISPHGACILILKQMVYAQSVEQPVDFSNTTQMINFMTVRTGLVSLVLNIVFWGVAFWYCEQVFPNEWGVKKHPLFFIRWLWKRNSSQERVPSGESFLNEQQPSRAVNRSIVEQDRNQLAMSTEESSVKLENVVKVYEGGVRVVDNLSLIIPKGEVFVLLGHNGAGKTTTISMLTGLIEPTSGSISAFGIDLKAGIEELRKRMGVCPQYNVIYDNLTVEEHLALVGCLKGCEKQPLSRQIRELLGKVDLQDKAGCLAKNLSGGQKRRLCVAMAFIGGSEVIFLDEPTSGMDPSARRCLWQMIKDARSSRIIILTTHYMDEADFLGDQIAIMSEGRLVCSGSSVFLKNKFGLGYSLTAVKTDEEVAGEEIIEHVRRFIPEAKTADNGSLQLTLQLPMNSTNQFPRLLESLQQHKQKLGIRAFGVSAATLEDVFLQVAEATNNQKVTPEKTSLNNLVPEVLNDTINSNQRFLVEPSNKLFLRHCKVTLTKRWRVARKDKNTGCFECYLPMFLIAFSILILKIHFTRGMHPQLFGWNVFEDEQLPIQFPVSGNVSSMAIDRLVESINHDNNPYIKAKGYTHRNAPEFDKQVLLPVKSQMLKAGVFVVPPVGSALVYYVLVNTRSVTTPFTVMSTMCQAIINSVVPSPVIVEAVNKPLPLTKFQEQIRPPLSGYLGGIAFTMALSLKFASVIAFIVRERQSGCKQQQLLSGMDIRAYWLSNFVYDLLMYLLVAVPGFLACMVFNIESLTKDGALFFTGLNFLLFGLAGLPFTYLCGFLFADYGMAQAVFYFINFAMGSILPTVVVIMRVVGGNGASTALSACWLLRLLPVFSFGEVLMNLASRQELQNSSTEQLTANSLTMPSLLYLVGSALLYSGLLMLSQSTLGQTIKERLVGLISRCKQSAAEPDENCRNEQQERESDVVLEEQVAKSSDPQECAIVVTGLTKVFKDEVDKIAVKDVSFTVKRGEVFGLLGVNGAGKSTLFKMLTGELGPTHGTAYFEGHSISQREEVRRLLGYCPQFDALLGKLTVTEQLELYYELKGLPYDGKMENINKLITELNLTAYTQSLSQNLSGGNKRKLSLACAMLGDPPILLLDEPSSGMDPAARRFMWRAISRVVFELKLATVVLTTHSMQEAEALSTRLTIMVGGQFRCMGPPQYIKCKFGEGYELELKVSIASAEEVCERLKLLNGDQNRFVSLANLEYYLKLLSATDNKSLRANPSQIVHHLQQVKCMPIELVAEHILNQEKGEAIRRSLNELSQKHGAGVVQQLEQFQNFYRYRLAARIPAYLVFSLLESSKESHKLEQYCLKQASVEQVLNSFAQQEDRENTAIDEQ